MRDIRRPTVAWLAAAAVTAGAGSAGCNLISGLADLRIEETASTGGAGGTGGGTGGDTGGTSTGGTGGTGGGTGGMSTGGSTCSDSLVNGAETDTDCGGTDCPPCNTGQKCVASTDCKTEICSGPDGGERCAKAVRIAVGNAHACAVLDSGALYCWGANDAGQLGVGGVAESPSPVKVALADVVEVTAGGLPGASAAHTCALDAARQAYCWGANDVGQLGKGDTNSTADPVLVATLSQVGGVVAGGAFTCASLLDGNLYCWGSNQFGELGDGGDGSFSQEPKLVVDVNVDGVAGLAAGTRHVCAWRVDGKLVCWGDNTRSQVALPISGTEKPAVVPALSGVQGAAAGQDFACARDATALSCWGDNTDRQLTDAVVADHVTAPATLSLTGVLDVALGADGVMDGGELGPTGGHACALLDTAKVTCWGNDRSGQLGRGTISASLEEGAPQEIEGLGGVVKIAAGTEVSCAILDTGAVRCWGKNDRGQLGAGTMGSAQSSPVAVQWP